MAEPTGEDHELETTDSRPPYEPPRLVRLGKLTDLTAGGGGKRFEPSKRRTRF
jgi:hypothetical protein